MGDVGQVRAGIKCPHLEDRLLEARGGWSCSACTYFNAADDAASAGRRAEQVQ